MLQSLPTSKRTASQLTEYIRWEHLFLANLSTKCVLLREPLSEVCTIQDIAIITCGALIFPTKTHQTGKVLWEGGGRVRGQTISDTWGKSIIANNLRKKKKLTQPILPK